MVDITCQISSPATQKKHSTGVHCARTKHGKNLANSKGPNRGVGPFEPNVYFDHEISEALMFNHACTNKIAPTKGLI